MNTFINYLNNLKDIFNNLDATEVELFINKILDARENNKMVFVIGNGGSAANASHFAQDLAKGVIMNDFNKKRIKALSLTDNLPYISALSNDIGYDIIFVEQLKTFANKGDMLILISGSGNSPNIVKACEWANENNIYTVSFTGFNGGKLKKISQLNIHIDLNEMCTVESIHSIIFHYVILELQKKTT